MAKQMDRRRFLKVIGVTGGGVAATGCSTGTPEKLIPYLVPPENQIPGIATYYATTCRECPAGCGMHVRVREGRAVKVEGNPGSPLQPHLLPSPRELSEIVYGPSAWPFAIT